MAKRTKQNICTKDELEQVILDRSEKENLQLERLITEMFGTAFCKMLVQRERELTQRYAEFLGQALETTAPGDEKYWKNRQKTEMNSGLEHRAVEV